MARMTPIQKILRVLDFLREARRGRIAPVMALYGFDRDAFEEGWHLLQTAGTTPPDPESSPKALRKDIKALEDWEKLWFPIARAVLRRFHPKKCDKVFRNLEQVRGDETIIAVNVFLDRLDDLPAKPVAVLAKHGLTPKVRGHARALVKKATSIQEAPASTVEPGAFDRAVAKMWDFYLHWSAIARAVIKDRRLLRKLGFCQTRRAGRGAPRNKARKAPRKKQSRAKKARPRENRTTSIPPVPADPRPVGDTLGAPTAASATRTQAHDPGASISRAPGRTLEVSTAAGATRTQAHDPGAGTTRAPGRTLEVPTATFASRVPAKNIVPEPTCRESQIRQARPGSNPEHEPDIHPGSQDRHTGDAHEHRPHAREPGARERDALEFLPLRELRATPRIRLPAGLLRGPPLFARLLHVLTPPTANDGRDDKP